jgi:DNA adenine methylase
VVQFSENTLLSADTAKRRPLPFVKWAGGKGSLLSHILRHVPDRFSSYYEPFLGGGAVFLAIYAVGRRFNAVLSDVNAELINAYEIIKEAPEDLIRVLSKLEDEYSHSKSKSSYFYEMRRAQSTDPIRSAARLLFLNKTCYNGLYRVNSRGEFNVPFGRYKNPRIVDAENIRTVNKALQETKAQLRRSDYKTILSCCHRGDFVYLDPPYQPKSNTSSFTDYTPGGFSENDQEELAKQFKRLVERGCNVLLSNSETPLTARLYAEYETKTVTVNRPINSVGSGRTGYKELIVVGALD